MIDYVQTCENLEFRQNKKLKDKCHFLEYWA